MRLLTTLSRLEQLARVLRDNDVDEGEQVEISIEIDEAQADRVMDFGVFVVED